MIRQQIHIPIICMIVTFLFLSMTHAISKTDDILAHIRHNDNQALQGCLIYNLTTHKLYGSPVSNSYQHECIIYTKKGNYKIETQSSQLKQKDVATIISNEHNTFYSMGNSMEIHPKSSFIPGIPKNIAWLLTMIPGPCAYIGRGFAYIKHPVISYEKNDVIFTGDIGDGSYIRAVLDPAHGYVAKEISRYTKIRNLLMRRWIMNSWKRSQDGAWIPTIVNSTEYDINNGRRTETDNIHILQASFQAPPSSSFNLSVEGKTVFDNRFGIPVEGKQEFAGESLNQVLQGTGSVAHQLVQMREAAERAKSRERLIQALVTGLFVCTLIAFAWIMRRRKTPA